MKKFNKISKVLRYLSLKQKVFQIYIFLYFASFMKQASVKTLRNETESLKI